MAVSAATRLGLTPPSTHLDTTSVHVDGRDHRDEEPTEPVVHLTKGDRRDPRPDLNHGMWARMVEHPAGLPVLMPPLSGHSRAGNACGPMVREPRARLHTPDGTTSRVAERARYRDDHRQKLAETHSTWLTRVPAT